MNLEFIQALDDIERERGISKDVLIEAIEAALISAYRRNFGSAQNVRVEIDRATGQVRVLARKTIAENPADPRLELSLEEVSKFQPDAAVGDSVETEVTPREFGRIAAQTAKQVVVQRIREAERGIIYEEFSSREGDIVTGVVQRLEHRNVFIDLGKAEAILAPQEQTANEVCRTGDRIKAYIVEVRKTTKGPQIFVSRTHPGLLKRLFELEVPEIHDGIVEVKAIAREPGLRSKIGVYSREQNVDPVGACVGPKGIRVQTVVQELRGEKVDIVKWDPDAAQFAANALSPAKVTAVKIREKEKIAEVTVPDHQLSLAIGKEGQNARLAAKLTGWKIDIKSESQAREVAARERAEQERVEQERVEQERVEQERAAQAPAEETPAQAPEAAGSEGEEAEEGEDEEMTTAD